MKMKYNLAKPELLILIKFNNLNPQAFTQLTFKALISIINIMSTRREN